ncbi:uncharacterized protein LOC144154876 isoform X1 [Haemaphysalis longicornis]
MHTTEVGVNNVPAFLVKLWKLVEDEKCNNLISWSSNGQSFIIHNQTQFAKELLPLYFKHNNMASFIRQLNMYGFRKVTNIDQGLRSDREEIEFFHNFFIRGQECLLEFIKRKVPSGRGGGSAAGGPEEGRARAEVLRELLSDVGSMQGRQEHMDQLLADMKKENEALWREVARLRQKHLKQQQIVEKLIQFLVTMVQANRNITVKRKMPLMLHDSPSNAAKVPRLSKAYVTDYQVSSPAGSTLSEGPVIRDVTDLVEDMGEASSTVIGETVATSPRAVEVPGPALTPPDSDDVEVAPIVASPLSTGGAIEPLCLLEPLQGVESAMYVLPCDEEVAADSSESSPKESAAASSKSQEATAMKALQLARPAVSTGKQMTTGANSTSAEAIEGPALVGEKPLANGASDLLSSCVMLEGIPMFSGDTDSPSGRGSPSPVVDDDDAGHKDVAPPASPGMQVALQDKPSGPTRVFADHVESIDSDLDWLQDQLMSGGLNLDTSTLMGVCPDWTGLLSGTSKLFSPEDHLTSCLGDLATESRSSSDAVGNELVQYTPSLLDLGIEEDPSFQPVNELLLSDDELPTSSSAANGDSADKAGSERSLSVRSPSPCRLYAESVKPVVQTMPRLVAKKGTSCSKKRRGTSRK